MRRAAQLVCLGLLCVPRLAQETAAPDVKAEDAKAQALYDKQDYLGALPLYEDMHAKVPSSMLFDERLAMCLLAKAATQKLQEQLDQKNREYDYNSGTAAGYRLNENMLW